ncbi:MAG: tetratricopeptide repeat protein [Gammaproteobacteria bacterium]|nr:tetratricopeptide repeat protein [Gammaproteobacteria bacterium]
METAEQELEALKQWWNENGRTLVVGVVLGLGGVFGWTTYQGKLEADAEALSIIYQQVVDAASEDQHEAVRAQATSIMESSPESGYASLGALLAAKSAYQQKDLDGAKNYLFWIVQNAGQSNVRDVARIRLARILVEEKLFDEVESNLNAVENQTFSPTVNEIRGDMRLIQGDVAGAREAYESTLNSDNVSGATRTRVQMKLDDLGIADDERTTG